MTVNDARIYGLDGKSCRMLKGGHDPEGMIDREEGKSTYYPDTGTNDIR